MAIYRDDPCPEQVQTTSIGGSVSSRESYHIEIHAAIDRLEVILERLIDLKNKIDHGDNVPVDAKVEEPPQLLSLGSVLSNSAEDINQQIERTLVLINQIEEKLF